MMLYSRNKHNIVKQLHSNKIMKKKPKTEAKVGLERNSHSISSEVGWELVQE